VKRLCLILLIPCLGFVSRGADPPKGEKKKPVVEETWFKRIDGNRAKAQYIDLNSTERLYIRYGPMADSGVELERNRKGTVLWRVHVQPLGIAHSLYSHHVLVEIEDGKIFVNSFGWQQIFEIRDLKSGDLISRKVTDETRLER
jgi:hypothetical protein